MKKLGEDTQTHREQGNLIRLLTKIYDTDSETDKHTGNKVVSCASFFFFQNKGSVLKMSIGLFSEGSF
jgi:hypothetical protein